MFKTVIKVEGMMCPMCEKHTVEALTKAFPDTISSAVASHEAKNVVIESSEPLDYEKVAAAISGAGYTPLGVEE